MNAASLAPAGAYSSLDDALADFRLVLDRDQQTALSSIKSVPDAESILVFTAQLDLANRNRRGQSIGSRLYTLLLSVRDFCAIVDTFVSSHPEVAALVWGSVKLTMQIILNYTSYFEAISELFMRLGHLCPLFAEYQALYPSSRRLQETLSNFHTALIRCCKHVVKASQRPWVNQTLNAMWRSFDDEFRRDREEIGRCSDLVKDAIQAAKAQADVKEHKLQAREREEASQGRSMISHMLRRTNHYRHETREWQLEGKLRRARERKQRVLDALSTYNHLKPLKQNQRKRYYNTANWIFQLPEFEDWVHRPNNAFLWVSGKIGSGKTIATASVIDYLLATEADPNVAVSFFFVQSDDHMSSKAETMIKSILKQRLPSAADLSDKIESQIKAIIHSEDVDGSAALLDDLTCDRKTFYIIIDGLDECEMPERTTLLKFLASVVSICTNVKLLMASRESLQDEIRKYFPEFRRISTGGIGTSADIEAYVSGSIHEKIADGDLRTRDFRICGEIKDALIKGADGMFIWVFFQVQEICSQHCDDDIRKTIKNLPRGLPETFCRALRRIKAEHHAKAAGRVFPWISAAIRPLSLSELQEALAVEIGQRHSRPERLFNDMDRVASWCQNLVQVDEDDHTVQFVHQTVRQFLLEDPIEPGLTDFHSTLEESDHTIGEICVTYLNFSDFKRTVGHMRKPVWLPPPSKITQKAYGKRSIPALALRMKTDVACVIKPIDIEPIINTTCALSSKSTPSTRGHPFLDYATANWFPHTKCFAESSSKTWRLWKNMVTDEYGMMPGAGEVAGFILHDASGKELLERICRIRHHGMVRLISSSGSLARREIITGIISGDRLPVLEFIVECDAFREDACKILMRAAGNGNTKAVEMLLAAGSDIVGDEDTRKAALYLAAKGGHQQIVDSLLALANDGEDANTWEWIAYHELTIHPNWPPGRLLKRAGTRFLNQSLLGAKEEEEEEAEDVESGDNELSEGSTPHRVMDAVS